MPFPAKFVAVLFAIAALSAGSDLPSISVTCSGESYVLKDLRFFQESPGSPSKWNFTGTVSHATPGDIEMQTFHLTVSGYLGKPELVLAATAFKLVGRDPVPIKGFMMTATEAFDVRNVRVMCDGSPTKVPPRTISASEQSVSSDAPNFRNVRWKMSRAEVIAAEGQQPKIDQGDALGFETVLAGKKAALLYEFISNNLVRGTYVLMEKHSDSSGYLEDADLWRSALIEKYGTPISEDRQWKNSLFRENSEDRGKAVAAGHLTEVFAWRPSYLTIIELETFGDNFEITVRLRYTSTLHINHIEKRNQQKRLSGF